MLSHCDTVFRLDFNSSWLCNRWHIQCNKERINFACNKITSNHWWTHCVFVHFIADSHGKYFIFFNIISITICVFFSSLPLWKQFVISKTLRYLPTSHLNASSLISKYSSHDGIMTSLECFETDIQLDPYLNLRLHFQKINRIAHFVNNSQIRPLVSSKSDIFNAQRSLCLNIPFADLFLQLDYVTCFLNFIWNSAVPHCTVTHLPIENVGWK